MAGQQLASGTPARCHRVIECHCRCRRRPLNVPRVVHRQSLGSSPTSVAWLVAKQRCVLVYVRLASLHIRSSVMSSSGPTPTLTSVPVSPNKSPKRGPAGKQCQPRLTAARAAAASTQSISRPHQPSHVDQYRTEAAARWRLAALITRLLVRPAVTLRHLLRLLKPTQSLSSTSRRGPPLQHYATISSRSPHTARYRRRALGACGLQVRCMSLGIDGLHIVEGNEEDEARKEQEDTTDINQAASCLRSRPCLSRSPQQCLASTAAQLALSAPHNPAAGSPRSYYGNDLDTLMVGGVIDGAESIMQPTQTTKNRSPRELSDGRNGMPPRRARCCPYQPTTRSVSVSMGQLSRRAEWSMPSGHFGGVTASQHFAFNAAAGISGTATPAAAHSQAVKCQASPSHAVVVHESERQ